MRTAIVAGVCVAMTLLAPVTASAQSSDCRIVDGQLICGIVDPPTTDPTPPGPSVPSPFITTYTQAPGPCPVLGEILYLIEVRLRATGEVVSSTLQCLGPVTPVVPPPPPPPTLGAVVGDIKDLLELDTQLSPPPDGFGGVSQLDTWLWCGNDGDVSTTLTLNGWTVTATARITNLTWMIIGPDGTIRRTASDCGEEPDPDSDGSVAAATWIPNEPGDYSIALAAEWGGTWTRTFGGSTETLDLGTVTVDGEIVDYTVVEIQTVGVGPPTP